MRRIGLLGGMSWESTAEYYRLINREAAARLGGLHSARVILASVDFAEVEAMQVAGDRLAAGELLAGEAVLLESGGAELLLICTNTMHKVADTVRAAVGIPLLHVADVTAAAVRDAGLTGVGLLGTASSTTDCAWVLSASSRVVAISRWSTRWSHRARTGLILGCTEIELLLDPDDPVPRYPSSHNAHPCSGSGRRRARAGLTAGVDDPDRRCHS
jgi:aspartate racemase